ncbi:MAG: LPS-assembly protein LptD [Gammaproteobacteria bacterium]
MSACLIFTSSAFAFPDSSEGRGSLCAPLPWLPERPLTEMSSDAPDEIHITADSVDLIGKGISVLTGKVQILSGRQHLEAQRVWYNEGTGFMDVQGNVRFWDEGLYASGERGRFELFTKLGRIEQARFRLDAEHARGQARGIVIDSRDEVLQAEEGTYTTCDAGNRDWLLRGKNIKLNRRSEVGSAWNVTLSIKGVPVLYSPFLTFPLTDKRKSGFLPPRFGTSAKTGIELLIPYYWNIAPNQDATFTARGMTQRGALLAGEYRFLTQSASGQLGLEYLPYDLQRGTPRGALSLQTRWNLTPRWGTQLDINQVSDTDYLADLGTSLEFSSIQFLERRGDVHYRGDGWAALGRVQSYQTVDQNLAPEERPYARLPQLLVSNTTRERNRRFNAGYQVELANFERRAGVTGARIDVQPSFSYPLRSAALFFVPRANVRYTGYYLGNTPLDQDNEPSRLLPTLSVDAGAFLERSWHFGTESFIQSLEPRAYYLFVPFEDQTDIPVFDTGRFTFGFDQLFRDNRFSGPDRVGDANQLTLAFTSRLLSTSTGKELLRTSLGQIVYFRDREVNLPEETPQTGSSSDIVADVGASLFDSWRFSGGFQWNTNQGHIERLSTGLRYQPDRERVINLSYRFRQDVVNQSDFSFRYPVGRRWGIVGRWTYAFDGNTTVDTFAGLEYESCCFAVRAIARRFLTDSTGEFNTGFFLQLHLKGLGGLGKEAAAFLQQSIPGYEPGF